jgi:hypothetical protein
MYFKCFIITLNGIDHGERFGEFNSRENAQAEADRRNSLEDENPYAVKDISQYL